jgi:hypothetical protein
MLGRLVLCGAEVERRDRLPVGQAVVRILPVAADPDVVPVREEHPATAAGVVVHGLERGLRLGLEVLATLARERDDVVA